MDMMKAARLHEVGAPLRIEEIPIPRPGPQDVLVRVRSCGVVPNLANVLTHFPNWFPHLPLPPLPAIFGLDPAGEVVAVGAQVFDWHAGDRVYVNPALYCGGCRACREGEPINCAYFAFSGYFGFTPASAKLYEHYPYGGLAEYMTAPQYALVKLPANVSFDQGARFGYLGTMYSAMRKAGVGPGKTLLVNGISGTLGIGGALLGIAMGATRIFGTARNKTLLERVKALAPGRIEVFSTDDGPIDDWVRSRTGQHGVDVYVDALGPGTSHDAVLQGVRSLKRGGRAINVGGVMGEVPLPLQTMMSDQKTMEGSVWFTSGEAQHMADMAEAGLLDLSSLQHIAHPLADVNAAISGTSQHSHGGFANHVIHP